MTDEETCPVHSMPRRSCIAAHGVVPTRWDDIGVRAAQSCRQVYGPYTEAKRGLTLEAARRDGVPARAIDLYVSNLIFMWTRLSTGRQA